MSGTVSTSSLLGLKRRQPQQHNQTHVSFTEVGLLFNFKKGNPVSRFELQNICILQNYSAGNRFIL